MKKLLQQRLSFFLLLVVLTTQVGIHALHHHVLTEHATSDQVTFQTEDHQHCTLCDLDLFLAQELPVEFNYYYTFSHQSTLIVPATSAVSFSLIFSPGRAPPVC